jgi:hypothetical protein
MQGLRQLKTSRAFAHATRARPARWKAAAGCSLFIAIVVVVCVVFVLPNTPSTKGTSQAPAIKNPHSDASPSPNFVNTCSASNLDSSGACLAAVVSATTNVRAREGVRALTFDAVGFRKLTIGEQLFVLVDLERTARGIAPFVVLSSQLDQVALKAARDQADPRMGANPVLTGSGPIVAWGSNWAGGTPSAAATNYYWMYEDGPGSSNVDCTPTTLKQCWGHRDNILDAFSAAAACSGRPVVLAMGAAEAPGDGTLPSPSFTELMSASCGPSPSSVVMTWSHAQALINAAPG